MRRVLKPAAILTPIVTCVITAGLSGCGVTQPSLTSANNTGTLVISTQAVNFGSVTVGQTAGATVSVSNDGSAPVQIEQIQTQGSAFAVTGQNTAPISIAAGKSYSLDVSFHPTSAGATTGALILTSSLSSDSQVTIALSGTGESVATAAPALDGLTCRSGSMTGAGTDACTVTLTAAAGTGGLTVALSSSSTAVSVPASVTVPAGATSAGFTATVSSVTAAQTARLTASAGSVTESYTIQLGTAAAGALSGLTCRSGSMTGAGTDSCTVTLTAAAGTGGLTVALSSSSTAVSVPASVTVPAGATSAGFTATVSSVTAAQTARLTASADGVTESYTIQLGAAAPGLTLQSTSVSFGDVSLNTPATQTVLMTSSGTAALTISAASLTGAGFSLTGSSFPLTLQPGQTAILDIQFDPKATGAATGAVTLTTNTSTGTAKIALSGTGETADSYEVDLSWNPPTSSTDPVAGYDIYRAVSGSSSYQLLNSDVDDVATYTDSTVQNGAAYTYYVESVDASGNRSAPSNLFSVTIP